MLAAAAPSPPLHTINHTQSRLPCLLPGAPCVPGQVPSLHTTQVHSPAPTLPACFPRRQQPLPCTRLTRRCRRPCAPFGLLRALLLPHWPPGGEDATAGGAQRVDPSAPWRRGRCAWRQRVHCRLPAAAGGAGQPPERERHTHAAGAPGLRRPLCFKIVPQLPAKAAGAS